MKIRTSLILSPALTALLLLLCVGSSLWLLDWLQEKNTAQILRSDRTNKVLFIAQQQLGLLHSSLYRAVSVAATQDEKLVKDGNEARASKLKALSNEVVATFSESNSSESSDELKKFTEQVLRYNKAALNAVDLATVDVNTGMAAMQDADAEVQAMAQTVANLSTVTSAQHMSEAQANESRAGNGVRWLASLTLLACAAMLVFSWSTQKRIVLNIERSVAVATKVAAGDLSQDIAPKGNDETARLLCELKNMQISLTEVVNNVRQNSESVASASEQIAQGNQDLSQRTEKQASSLQETATSMEQLGAAVAQNANSAAQANQLAVSASNVASQGGSVVSQVVETMKDINDSSRKIADIIGVIDGIAFQTNILALNAAVEAARAGEQGRGFAVVASEVRSLAGRSAEAAKEIKSLIAASVERVEKGSALVDQAGETMSEVVNSIKRVTDIMGEISNASNEQSAGVAKVGAAVGQLDEATQQNAALVEESAAAAESLRNQAQQLVHSVAVFKLKTH